ncbi:hypothetical protein [Chelativorans xinjiangense]|uniref:hypothetical protein n=1 Tax=Chelativorans xinjiangense TaxID=2681485 RepID=UPI001FE81DBF|nr:hypothetical protein [Chelativorans xinjiangense]
MKSFGACANWVAAGLGLIVIFGLTAAAGAQGRPDARALTCGQARTLIQQRGAAVLTTGRYTYDRFVASERYCAIGFIAKRAYVQTRDAQSCTIGYTCVIDTDDDDRWWRLRRR